MDWLKSTLNSSIGMKWTMALSGLGLFVFVLAHMAGNLQIYAGPDLLNQYAVNLRHLGPLLWVARLGLLALAVVHIASAIRLTQINRAARPVAYAVSTPQVSGYAARSMLMGGLIILGFLLYHLAHFTLGLTNPEQFSLHDAEGRHDVYAMVVLGFRQPLISGLYILAMIPLVMHLSHGVSSALQTLGLNSPKYDLLLRSTGPVLGAIVFIGNVSIPLAVLAGLIPYPVAGH
jgi:succinate dehydrogenase / fumarate reductase cytochrome b subunit